MKPILTLLTVLLLALAATSHAAKPNIVLIVADDLGYGDVGCYGATKIKTPRMDALAGEGVRFTDAHAVAAVCNPSRYSILSGTYLWHAKRRNNYSLYFHDGQVTLPSLLKSAGYRTAALGKWHNGFGRVGDPDWNAELKPGPLEIGFDYFFGTPRTHNEPPLVFVENHRVVGLDPADPIRIDKTKGPHGEMTGGAKAQAARLDERIDYIMAEKAATFFSQQSKDAPFFLYLAFAAPHVPINPAPEFRGKSQAGLYGDYVQQLDHCTGLVLDALAKHGFASNTLVIVTSDNGAVYMRDALDAGHRPNGVLLGQKTDAWEGGHRVPLIARWPGRIPSGSERKELFSQVDIMATFAEAAGVALPAGASPDGASELAAFLDPSRAPAKRTEAVFLGTGGHALRQGDWVYLPKQGSCGMTVQAPPGAPWGQPYAKLGLTNSDVDAQGKIKPDAPPAQLYNLRDDLHQATNRFNDQPELAKQLAARLDSSLPKPVRAKRPSLWAVYYAWYQTGGKSSIWTIDGTSKPRSKAEPLIGYYDSDNAGVVRWHVRLAKAAGIEAFLCSWWGGANVSGRAFEQTILPVAAEEKFKVAMCSELAQFHHDVNALARQMSGVLKRVKDSPAYLHMDGKPVVYLYQVPFDPKLTTTTFGELRRGIEAEAGPVYWMMDKVTNDGDRGLNFPDAWLKIPEIPMFGFYGTFSIKRIWKYDELAPHYRRLVQQAHTSGKKAFLPAHPGLDNSGIQSPYFIIPRDAGATLRGYLRAISDAGADVALITSFNEWPETTIVEPSSSWPDPYFYLKLLAEWKGVSFTAPPLPGKTR